MKLRKMMLNINGVDRMFMCDPENDKLSDVLRRIGLTGVCLLYTSDAADDS